jgi:hypothetical protein
VLYRIFSCTTLGNKVRFPSNFLSRYCLAETPSNKVKVNNLIVSAFPHISFVHIRREKNKRADELVNKALDG